MLNIQDKFPTFKEAAVVSNDIRGIKDLGNDYFNGSWGMILFYPKDFTFVCPTELIGFNDMAGEFQKRNCKIMGVSVDSEFVHLNWRKSDRRLSNLQYPLLSDIKKDLSRNLGILDEKSGVSNRALYLIDPDGIIRFVTVTDMKVGRNPAEVLRVLDALQTDELCGCSWKQGESFVSTNADEHASASN